MTNTMSAADFRKLAKSGDISLRGKGKRNLPEHVESAARQAAKPRGSGGVKTTVDGIKFPSKTEARVYAALKREYPATKGWILFRQVRYPLTNVAPNEKGVPLAITIDFELFHPETGRRLLVDAKCRRWKSREWVRGKAAFEARYGHRIEERER